MFLNTIFNKFPFSTPISIVNLCKKHVVLDHLNLLILVIGSTICLTLCQLYICLPVNPKLRFN